VKNRTHRFPVGSEAPSVEVRNPAGSVTVEAVEDAPEYVVEVEPLDSAAEELVDQVDVVATGSRLRVTAPERRLWRSPRFAVRVTVPRGTATRVAVASADADLRGELGPVEVTTASADGVVEHCSELQVRTASGDTRVGTVTGSATIGTASGNVRVQSVGTGLRVRTASGDVEVGAAAGEVSVSTASGDVGIDRLTGGEVRVKTASGDVSLGVVPGLRVWLDLSSVSGRMVSALEEDGAGPGGERAQLTLSVRSVSGDQRIRRSAA
jgi:Putative adhesin